MDGVTGLANTSDIAVDDFQLNPGACPAGIEGKKNVRYLARGCDIKKRLLSLRFSKIIGIWLAAFEPSWHKSKIRSNVP